jgi:hypothetical protein
MQTHCLSLLPVAVLAGCYPEPAAYWDNLLWYYAYQHKGIEKASTERETKRKLREQQGGYAKQKRRREREEHQQQGQQQEQQQLGSLQECQQHEQQHGQQDHQQQLEPQLQIEQQGQDQQQQRQASQQEPPQLQQHQERTAADAQCKTDGAVEQQQCAEAAGSLEESKQQCHGAAED